MLYLAGKEPDSSLARVANLTWIVQGMEELIRQAFLHIEVIGPHVAEGHYDLVGPNGDIILPQVWETVVEPDWTITMHMWPIPEKPKSPEPKPPPEVPPPPPEAAVVVDEGAVVAAPEAPKKSGMSLVVVALRMHYGQMLVL